MEPNHHRCLQDAVGVTSSSLNTTNKKIPTGTDLPFSQLLTLCRFTYLPDSSARQIYMSRSRSGQDFEAAIFASSPGYTPLLIAPRPRYHPVPDFTRRQISPPPRFHPAPDFALFQISRVTPPQFEVLPD